MSFRPPLLSPVRLPCLWTVFYDRGSPAGEPPIDLHYFLFIISYIHLQQHYHAGFCPSVRCPPPRKSEASRIEESAA